MYKLILILNLTALLSLNAQTSSLSEDKIKNANESFEKLFTEVNSNPGNYSIKPDLVDFKSKAQSGLNSIYPGSSINNLKCVKLTDLSLTSSEALRNYFLEIYKDDIDQMEVGWIENILSDFINRKSQFGLMQWEIFSNGETKSFKSIAVFDENWKVLYDTELANFTTYLESEEIMQSDNNTPNGTTAIKNQDSQTKSRLLTVNGAFGSRQVFIEARITAFVSPYITAATNDAEYNFFTPFINCETRNPTGIPPIVNYPFLYFGEGGTYAVLYTNAVPAESPIVISGGGDRFNNGLYNVTVTNGLNWSFQYDFSVDFPGGSIGITPVSNISALSLSATNNSSIKLENYIYNANVATSNLRAIFYDGGSLNADNFKILTGSGAGEIGTIRLTARLRGGYFDPPSVNPPLPPNFHFFSQTATAFDFPVQYLRGDHILQPTYQLTSTRYNIPTGQIDTLKAKIKNNSHAVKLNGGNISIDVSSLDNKLTLLSSATLAIGSVDTSATKEFKFVVRGNSNGIITPQVNISAMGWESPVPPTILINNITSIDTNIDVSPLIKTLTLTAPIQGFYSSSSNSMARDTLRVYLRNAISPFAIADSAKAYLNTSGTAAFSFSKAVNFTQYYIQTKHRNSIETWSKSTQFFINSALSYDFSSANTQAYGDNLIQIDASPVTYAVYGGDINQDGLIDLNDITSVFNDGNNFLTGYVKTDLTGDNIVDLTDLTIAYNNSSNFIGVLKP